MAQDASASALSKSNPPVNKDDNKIVKKSKDVLRPEGRGCIQASTELFRLRLCRGVVCDQQL